jgi:hypothetical protein
VAASATGGGTGLSTTTAIGSLVEDGSGGESSPAPATSDALAGGEAGSAGPGEGPLEAAAGGTGATGALPTALTGATDRATGLADAVDVADDGRAAYGALAEAEAYLGTHPKRWITLLGWALTRSLGGVVDREHAAAISRTWYDEWLLGRSLQRSAVEMGVEEEAATLASGLARVLLAEERALWVEGAPAARCVMEALLRDGDVQEFLRVNRARDVLWFDKERFEELARALLTASVVLIGADASLTPEETTKELAARQRVVEAMLAAEQQSGYRVEELLRLLAA